MGNQFNLQLLNMTDIEKRLKENYPIQIWLNNPILRTKSTQIDNFTDDIKQFVKILHKWMEIYDWVWLAAPQIWVNKRIISISQLNKKEDRIIFSDVLINPQIIEKSTKVFLSNEGCLSLPGMEGEVSRHFKIKVKYLDINWKKHELNAIWLNAAIIQHEIDHLDWILFRDKVVSKKWADFKKLLNL